jgi:PAS domain S-box-containing protein
VNSTDNGHDKGNLLIVDDELPSLRRLSDILVAEGYEVRGAPDGSTALMLVETEPPELILLDIQTPEMDGYRVCRQLKENENHRDIPVLLLGAPNEVEDRVKGFEAGAIDFITKPFQAEEIVARVNTHLELSRLRRNLEQQVAKRTEELLEQNEKLQMMKFSMDHALDRVAWIAPDGRLLYANRATYEEMGYPPEEVLTMSISDIDPNFPVERWAEHFQEVKKKGSVLFETQNISGDGKIHDVEVSTNYLKFDDQEFLCAFGRDITEHKRIENKLGQFKHIVETTGNPIGMVDRNLLYQYVNEPYCQAFNKSVEEIIGHSVPELFGRNFFEKFMEPYYKRCLSGNSVRYQTWFDFPGWGRRYLDVCYYPFREADGRVAAVVINIHDITESEELELNLGQSEARFRAFMDNYPAVIYIKDEANRHVYGNKYLLKSFGKRLDEFIGTNSYDFFPREIAKELEEKDQFVMSSNNPTQIEYPGKMLDGAIHWWRDIKFPIHLSPGIKLLGGIAVDITDRKRAEQALDERLRFEKLISNLSTSFIHAGGSEVDGRINDALRQLGEFLGVDRGCLAQFNEERSELRATHLWVAKGLERDEMFVDSVLNEKIPWVVNRILKREVIALNRFEEELPVEASKEREYGQKVGIQSLLVLPLTMSGSLVGLIGFDSLRSRVTWPEELVQRLRVVAEIFANALTRERAEAKLQEAFAKIKELKNRLEAENVYLREEVQIKYSHEEIVGQSQAVKTVLRQAEQVADTESTVLILGETGTGKELLARAIHNLSLRRGRTMMKVNCAALPSTLIESELFGREKGAYTGALTRQVGRFEVANGSTIFLDEISELSLEVQAKLLRVLEDGQFERLGSTQTIKVDVRIIAATNQDLAKAVMGGQFREDLYYRLNVFPITVPPLRERRGDIPMLVWAFAKEFGETMGKRIERIPQKSMDALQGYGWPGNIRELRNLTERAMILTKGSTLHIALPETMGPSKSKGVRLEEIERRHILRILEETRWRISGDSGAAKRLGLKPTTLRSRMEKLDIKRPH